jgi:FkbM family methyltransferase
MPFDGWAEPGFERGCYGINVRDWLYTGVSKGYIERRAVRVDHPPVDEEYFEWIALLTAVAAARDRFCLAEIGAGWGRWMISAAALCRQRRVPFHLVGVEAEPSHFEWIKMVLRDNDIDPDVQDLWCGAVADRDRDAVLLTGPDPPEQVWGHRTIRPDQLASWVSLPGYKLRAVPGFSIETVLSRCEYVDLVDIDVQGVEHEILEPAFETLDMKVGIVHVGTHSTEAEQRLRAAFTRRGWHNAFSFPSHREVTTPFGAVAFTDGVETWVHPERRDLLDALTEKGSLSMSQPAKKD